MSAVASPRRAPVDASPPVGPDRQRRSPRATDEWPSTHRIMPWLVAAFTFMVYIVPFDSINFTLGLPVDSQFDRLLLILVLVIWLGVAILPSRTSLSLRHSPVNLWIFVYLTLCFLSLCFNLRELMWNGEMGLSVKQLLLSLSYIAFFYVAATSLRRGEILPLIKLAVALAAISSIGTIYEFRSGSDLFYRIGGDLFRPLHAVVKSAPTAVAGQRNAVDGPTGDSLADATLLGVTIPFALALSVYARRPKATVLWGLATVLILAGCICTGRKSALVIPIPAIIAMILYDPRRYLRFWPLLIVAVGVIIVAAPHAISTLLYQFKVANNSSSTDERTMDYSEVAPYIAHQLLLGRGFGSFSPHKYIILDDTMLGLVVQIGALGAAAYAAIIGAAAYVAHRAARVGAGLDRGLMAAGVGACLGFFISNFLYDASSFRQGPYLFFLFAAFIVVYADRGRRASSPASTSTIG